MIMSFCNSGKTLNLIRKSVEAALNDKMVLFVNVETRPEIIAQRFFAYREDDIKLANNINHITIPSGTTGLQYFRDYIELNPHYDLIAFDMPQIVTITIDALHEFISEIKTYADVIFTTQANREVLTMIDSGESIPCMKDAFSCADSATFLIKANDPNDVWVESHVVSEFPVDINNGDFDANNVSSYYIDITDNGIPRLEPFHTSNKVNIWGIKQTNLIAILGNSDNYA